MNFGEVALAGGFVRVDQFASEKKFPLRLYFCEDCYAVQVIDKIPADVLFQNYFYFSSSIGTLRDHFKNYAAEVTSRFLNPETATVLEFGCNDGVLLKPLADQGIRTVIGVDPAVNVVASINDPRVTVINNFFTEEVANDIVNKYGKVDLVMANNVYAHIADIKGTTRAVANVLSDNGVFVFEVHYLGKVVNEMQYDMVYHEHLYYYSLISAVKHFDRYGLTVFDIKPVSTHAGSMRFYICKSSSTHSSVVTLAVKQLEVEERAKGFDLYDTFKRFSETVISQKRKLIEILNDLRQRGASIAGYGASGRANTMIQFCGIGHEHLDYMIDDAPAKEGFYTPGSHFKIQSSVILNSLNRPDYVIVFAWSFFDEILNKNLKYIDSGGRMILPLPEVTIFPSDV